MKINKLFVTEWDEEQGQYVVVAEESQEYHGPVALAFGGGGGGTQKVVQEAAPLSEEEKQVLGAQLEQLGIQTDFLKAAQSGLMQGGQIITPEFFPGQTFVPFSPEQEEGLQAQEDISRQQLQTIPGLTQGALQFGLQGVLDEGNPFFQQNLQAAIRPVTEQFQERILPSIGSAAQQAGAFGGSAQALLEAQATRDFTRNIGDITGQLAFDQFNRGLNTFERTLALTPQTLQAATIPAQSLAAVGDIRQGMDQQKLNEMIARFNFEQNIVPQSLAQASSILQGPTIGSGINFQGGSTTTTQVPGQSPLVGAIGGASAGAGIASALNLAGPAGWAVTGLGALAGLFG